MPETGYFWSLSDLLLKAGEKQGKKQ